jgi:hypothetical protein
MTDETDDIQTETTDEDDALYELLGIERPDKGEEFEELEEEQDEASAKTDKIEKKLSAKMDDMQKKFESTLLREKVGKFQESADDLEKDLFRTVASDVKDMESFDKAMTAVNSHAKKMREDAEKYKAQLEKQAEEQVSRAWGTGPMGTPTPRTPDYEKDLLERVRAGDDGAAFELIIGDDWPSL